MIEGQAISNKSLSDYYNLTCEEVCAGFQVKPDFGLTSHQVVENRSIYGNNQISKKKSVTIWQLVFKQLKNPLIIILGLVILIKSFNFFSEVVVGAFESQSFVELLMVLAVVLITAWVGVRQEVQAEKSLEKLRQQVKFYATVLREGKLLKVNSTEVVVGDVLILSAGDKIPADSRVLDANNSNVNESLLTGESEEVAKQSSRLEGQNIPLSGQSNIIFGGTSLLSGNLKAVVHSVGQDTEFGKISAKLESTKAPETRFQKQTKSLLGVITWISLVAFLILEIVYIFVFGYDLIESIEVGLALIIAFIPEALSAVSVIVLAISAKNLAQRGIIVKNLPAAEGMGSVSMFLTDKTGTITQGQMTVENLWTLNKAHLEAVDFGLESALDKLILESLSYCNNNKGATEQAMSKFVTTYSYAVDISSRIVEHGYSSDYKRMMVIRDNHQSNNKLTGYAKGAAEVLLPLCDTFFNSDYNKVEKLLKQDRRRILDTIEDYASKGLRVLLLARREFDRNYRAGIRENDEQNLTFLGLVCLLDPLREEVKDTVSRFKQAEIKLVMITGDHPNIAKYLGVESGICEPSDKVLIGTQLEKYSTSQLDQPTINLIHQTKVFARVLPKHKDFLVHLFKDQGEIVAMAGDGINDAVAIKKANIGVAVKNAVDWVKDIAGIVIVGGFDALANAVEEGRKIIYKARLFTHYLLSGNISQVGVFLLTSLFTKYPPLSSLQLLVINLLTDTLPALALAYEEVPSTVMQQGPESPEASLVNKPIWISILVQGLTTSLFLFWVFWSYLPIGLVYAQTATFFAYLCQKLYRAFTARSFTKSIFELGFLSNKMTAYSVLGSSLIAILLIWLIPEYVGMTIVQAIDFLRIALLALTIPLVEEVFKFVRRLLF